MGKIMILNGSPRAPKSNSKKYSEIFMKYSRLQCDYFNITKSNHLKLIAEMESSVCRFSPCRSAELPEKSGKQSSCTKTGYFNID